ncbi:MAG TPA: hypothetical protein VGS19_15500 [Streptosporangiaceae bacterium]|nr:hypothetical protein [Streptosporangiaceae bacterium]
MSWAFEGWLVDHVIAEVWDGPAGRWRLVEPEIGDGHTDPADGASFDALDVPRAHNSSETIHGGC